MEGCIVWVHVFILAKRVYLIESFASILNLFYGFVSIDEPQ